MSADAELLGWCVCGNISDYIRGGPEDDKFYQGTKMFSPGTKVYLGSAYWGFGGQRIQVIGLRRVSRAMVNCVIHIGVLENLRRQSIYSKSKWEKLKRLRAELFMTEGDADAYLSTCAGVLKYERPEKLNTETKLGPWGSYQVDGYRKR